MSPQLTPPLDVQLARSASELPTSGAWIYEPKWDGFRALCFKDSDSVYLQSRNKRPLNRYFPEVAESLASLEQASLVLDGELVVFTGEQQRFDLVSQRVHPARSRVQRLARETPATFVCFDLLACDGETLLDVAFARRRELLLQQLSGKVFITAATESQSQAAVWLGPGWEGVVCKDKQAGYRPGERTGMIKVKRLRSADCVVLGFRTAQTEDSVASLLLGLYNGAGSLRQVGHASAFTRTRQRELFATVEPYRTHETQLPEPSRFRAEQSPFEVLRPELVAEVSFDHVSEDRIRHGARLERFRFDKQAAECTLDQLHD